MAQVWTVKANVTTARFALKSASLGNDVLSFGGATSNPGPPTAANQLYSFTGNSWSSKASLPAARSHMGHASLSSDEALSLAGTLNSGADLTTNTTILYSLTGNSWTTRATMSTKRNRCDGAGLSSSTAIVFGGTITGPGVTASCELFDNGLNSWSSTGSLNVADRASGSTIGSDALKVNTTVEKYSAAGGTWSVRTNMNVPNTGGNTPGVSEYVTGVSVLAYGGQTSGYLTRTELYDDAGNTWTTVDSMNTSREALGGSSAGSQGALATGGFNGSTLNANELYASTGDFTRNAIYSDIPIEIDMGGTDAQSHTAYGVICGGETSTGSLQSVAVGSSGQIFVSGGSGALPSFQTASGIMPSRFQVLASDPAEPEIAQVWYNSTSQLYKGAQAVAGTWTAVNSMNTARRWLAGAGISTDALSFGGNTSASDPGSPSVVTESWDGSSWSAENNLNTARYGISGSGIAAAAVSFGGLVGGSPSAITETWNGTSWSSANNLNTARYAMGGVGSSSSTIAFGGVAGGASAVTESWNGTSWSSENNLNTARNSLAGAGTASDALSIGGSTNAVERWNGTTWVAKTALGTSRQQLGASGSANDALSYGGFTGSNSAVTERYNGVADSWSTVTSMNTAVTQLASSNYQSNSSSALSFGGYSASPTAVTEEYAGSPDIVIFDVS